MQDLGSLLKDLASRDEASCLAIVVQAQRGAVRAGAKVVFDSSGARKGGDGVFSDKLERAVGERAAAAIASGEPALADLTDESCGATVKVYLEPQQRGRELVVLGRGPVAAALSRLGEACGLRVRSVAGGFESLEPLRANAHAVVATGHEADEEALVAALKGEPATVQLVASSRRAPAVIATLREGGVPEEKLALIRSPAGLDLGGDSPEEIALAILAEIQALRHGGSGRPLAEVKGTRAPGLPTIRLPLLAAPPPALAAPPVPSSPVPSFLGKTPRKPKVKFAIDEDSDDFKIPTRHDEDFRPDEPAEKPARVTRKTKRSAASDDESFR